MIALGFIESNFLKELVNIDFIAQEIGIEIQLNTNTVLANFSF